VLPSGLKATEYTFMPRPAIEGSVNLVRGGRSRGIFARMGGLRINKPCRLTGLRRGAGRSAQLIKAGGSAMAFKKVKVNLHHIKNEATGDDSGDQLEIFGRFDVARLVFDPGIGEVLSFDGQNLWAKSSDDAVDLDQGAAAIVEASATLQINEGEFLQITGNLVEEDDTFGGADDDLGGIDIRIPFSDIRTTIVPIGQFQESDQRVSVKISTQVMQEG
jgi:hypothetical protein